MTLDHCRRIRPKLCSVSQVKKSLRKRKRIRQKTTFNQMVYFPFMRTVQYCILRECLQHEARFSSASFNCSDTNNQRQTGGRLAVDGVRKPQGFTHQFKLADCQIFLILHFQGTAAMTLSAIYEGLGPWESHVAREWLDMHCLPDSKWTVRQQPVW